MLKCNDVNMGMILILRPVACGTKLSKMNLRKISKNGRVFLEQGKVLQMVERNKHFGFRNIGFVSGFINFEFFLFCPPQLG